MVVVIRVKERMSRGRGGIVVSRLIIVVRMVLLLLLLVIVVNATVLMVVFLLLNIRHYLHFRREGAHQHALRGH